MGFSDAQIAHLTRLRRGRGARTAQGAGDAARSIKTVDTCAGEFPARTSYHYTTYEAGGASEFREASKPRVVILSAGPNRIGQGIEFDYCCVHAAYALSAEGYETVMVNCNPETVSTDYDTSDRLYFEPLTYEDVMDIVEAERPAGVIMTLGGQTPIRLAAAPGRGGRAHHGDTARRDRPCRGSRALQRAARQPGAWTTRPRRRPRPTTRRSRWPSASASRCSCVPATCWAAGAWRSSTTSGACAGTWTRRPTSRPTTPCYLDAFLEDAIELDVDALADGKQCYVGVGAWSTSRSAASTRATRPAALPPFTLSDALVDRVARHHAQALALSCKVKGLLNVQYAIKDEHVYVIELNPRASRTVPFSSKATGVPLAKYAARIMAGEKIADLDLPPEGARAGLLRGQGGRHALRAASRAPTWCSARR